LKDIIYLNDSIRGRHLVIFSTTLAWAHMKCGSLGG